MWFMNLLKSRKGLYILLATIVLIVAVVVVLVKSGSQRVVIEGHVTTCDDMMVYLERYDGEPQRVIDSMRLDKRGNFRFVVEAQGDEVIFYDLLCGWERLPLLCKAGDRVEIGAAGSVSLNYTVSGSQESELLRQFFQPYVKGSRELKAISSRYALAQRDGDDLKALAREYSNKYKEVKQAQMRYIVENKGELASIYAMTQRLPGDKHLMNEQSDMVYMQMIIDGVEQSHPNSPYLELMRNQVATIENKMKILNSVTYSDYPDIAMKDMFGEERRLSSLKGKVILLDFWSPQLAQSNQNNAEMREIYGELAPQGFEIYQVGVESDKSLWINAVQQQRLPWIAVSDLMGGASQSLGLYNITKLPANVLISRDGTIVATNLFGDELLSRVKELVKED